MAGSPDRSSRRHAKPPARRTPRPAHDPCALCRDKVEWVDYKNVTLLRSYLSDRGKIRARAATGACVRHQGEVSVAIKTARELVLLPYTQRTVTERPGGRGGGRDRGERGERGERAERTLSDTTTDEAPRRRDADVEVLVTVADPESPEAKASDVPVLEVVEVIEAAPETTGTTDSADTSGDGAR